MTQQPQSGLDASVDRHAPPDVRDNSYSLLMFIWRRPNGLDLSPTPESRSLSISQGSSYSGDIIAYLSQTFSPSLDTMVSSSVSLDPLLVVCISRSTCILLRHIDKATPAVTEAHHGIALPKPSRGNRAGTKAGTSTTSRHAEQAVPVSRICRRKCISSSARSLYTRMRFRSNTLADTSTASSTRA